MDNTKSLSKNQKDKNEDSGLRVILHELKLDKLLPTLENNQFTEQIFLKAKTKGQVDSIIE